MAISTVNIGSAPNDGTGDPLRTAFNKLNTNFLNITADGGDEITVTDPTTSTDATLNDALQNIFDNSGGATPDLQAVTDVGNIITDGVDTNTISASAVSISDGSDNATLNKTTIEFTDFINIASVEKYGFTASNGTESAVLSVDNLGFSNGVSDTFYRLDKITVNSVDYPLPTGVSSQIATLADITGGGYTVVNANLTAVNDTNYTVVANATFTDPTPTEGKGYVVYVRNGTATIGGVGYAVGSLVFRVYHSGSWSTREYKSNLTASDIPSSIDATKIADGSVSNTEFQYINSLTSNAQTQLDNRVITLLNDNVDSSPVTGTIANTIIKPYLIPANTLTVGDTIDFKTVVNVTGTNATKLLRLFTNTSNSLSGALTLATLSAVNTSRYLSLDRTYTLKTGNLLQSFPTGSSAVTDESAVTNPPDTTAFNPAVDNWFLIAIQPNNGSDSFVQTLCYITLMKAKTSI